MQLRRFSGSSSAAILTQIKAELGAQAVILDTQEQDGVITMTAALERNASAAEQQMPPSNGKAGWQNWQEEWGAIKGHLLSLMKPSLDLSKIEPRQRLALEFLQKEGLDDEVFVELFNRLSQDAGASILEHLAEMVAVRGIDGNQWKEQVQIFAGPFGVGKTSVALRVALLLQKQAPKEKICLINADATRGNGRLFLRHYCELAEMAYKEAASVMELRLAIEKAREEKFARIFIDLPGLARGKTLHALLDQAGFAQSTADLMAVHLVLSPHYGSAHLRDFFERYKTTHKSSIIWTKLDESEHFAALINASFGTGLPVSALSFGAGIGNSLMGADHKTLWRLLFKREIPNGA